ncbi:MAG: NADPH-dependent 2,4-dienoyl-CoA reductase [bacterium]|nr:NADPH-dependent 2,4-dienoyl-CoA reductase [bacterium]
MYERLLAPLTVRGFTLPNRVVMGAMHTRLETLDRGPERLAAFYTRRVRGGVGLILTGGHSPTPEGAVDETALVLDDDADLAPHAHLTAAVHEAGGRILLQLLHAGRYAPHPGCVAPSPLRARISRHEPRELTTQEVWNLVAAYGRAARLAREAGYAGVEVMGSEGYLISQFTAPATNHREDEFGGSAERRNRFPLEVVRAVREGLGDGLLVYRISAIDLVEGGMDREQTTALARGVEAAGADILNTGIGWHESAIPTIAGSVPRAAWGDAVREISHVVTAPVIASNRINHPDVAEDLLAEGTCQLVSLARPLLADPDFVAKAAAGTPELITPCIACNQACLDHVFDGLPATCMVNPRAGRELDFPGHAPAGRHTHDHRAQHRPAPTGRTVAVVGAGPAGIAFALEAADCGHTVTLFEAENHLGGQMDYARRIPTKPEFDALLDHWRARLAAAGVTVTTGHRVTAEELAAGTWDTIALATGVTPRCPEIEGAGHRSVVDYAHLLSGEATAGRRVAILGAGGVGFDVAEYLVGERESATDPATFRATWGVDESLTRPGGLTRPAPPSGEPREVHLFQRTPGPLGTRLGRTTGWILKSRLRAAGVTFHGGVTYLRIDDDGLHFQQDGATRVLAVDTVVLATGQESENRLAEDLRRLGRDPIMVGGADVAAELDAVRAIRQATEAAARL